MIYCDLHQQGVTRTPCHITFKVISFRKVLSSQESQQAVFLFVIEHFTDASEADYTGKTVPPLSRVLHRL